MRFNFKDIMDGANIKYWLRFVVNGSLMLGGILIFYYFLRDKEFIDHYYMIGLNHFATFLLKVSKVFTELFGFEVTTYGKSIRIVDDLRASNIFLDRGCMGRNVLLGYAALISIFPGGFKHKLWYIPMGLAIITFVNILRISGLAITAYCCPEYSDINHHYLFKLVAWIVIFILWVIWFNKFGMPSKQNSAKD